jgi:hypothetical protein
MKLPFLDINAWIGIGVVLVTLTGILAQVLKSKAMQEDMEGIGKLTLTWLFLFAITVFVILLVLSNLVQD